MIKFEDKTGLNRVESFLNLFGDAIRDHMKDRDGTVSFELLPDSENDYHDIILRLDNTIYISVSETGKLGLTEPEFFAALAHEVGHIFHRRAPWGNDHEMLADSFAAKIGLRSQMIRVIEKIIASRRFSDRVSSLVRRIQFLQCS